MTNRTWFKKPNLNKVWFCDDGKIIANESYTMHTGIRLKFYNVYANAKDRDQGRPYVEAKSFKEAKDLAHITPTPN